MMKFAVTLFCTLLLIAALVQAESATKRDVFAVEDEFGAARRGLFDNPGMDTPTGKGSKKAGKSGKGGSDSGKSGKGGSSSGKSGSKGSDSGKSGKGGSDSGKGSKKMGKGGSDSGKGSKKMGKGGSGKGGKGSKKMGKGGKGSKKDRIVNDFQDIVFGSMSM
eukprot:CAMPEP_0113659666 /NCGR_PEP_ID=MMETSP0017_2-20120614/32485_1 /TAXON_ID=2856 /ORGANISM="Cylindrotheca closterium" /LENGTH=162 /DNA_ID=CAMNT_0000574243 /DNA_START=33 /DNA_END=521 /DNA_ORIENTATION=+ /assembly_acc=CAM_ASM_000147